MAQKMVVRELVGGDRFSSSRNCQIGANEYVKLAYALRTQGGGFLNAVNLTDGQPTLFLENDVVDFVRHSWEFE